MKLKLKTPNFRKAAIGEVLTWAASANGNIKSARKQKLATEALTNIQQLSRIPSLKWPNRKWALPALSNIDKIGVTEKLELFSPSKPIPLPSGLNKMGVVAEQLGLRVVKINNRVVITTLTPAVESKMISDLPPEERGASRPLLPL